MMPRILLVVAMCASAVASPYRDGANHHLGDDSFVAAFGRAPTSADPEPVRMHAHLEYVRAWLATRPPTRPELATRRAELLGYLDDYIASGVTPRNTYVPWRSPVFIDRDGRICAVGYLIERSAGRSVAERIAASHRLAYLEDIAAARPEVAAWIDGSGFTLEELASIQPGYHGPTFEARPWHKIEHPADGAHIATSDDKTIRGAFAHDRMTGAWTVEIAGKVVGSGTLHAGAGPWQSSYPDGKRLAAGSFSANAPDGEWRFYHPSGRLAAIGSFRHGTRHGDWKFFYDDAGHTLLSTGRFAHDGAVVSGWRHYGPDGQLVATAAGAAGSGGFLTLTVEPAREGIQRVISQGKPADYSRTDVYTRGGNKLTIIDREQAVDGRGRALEHTDAGWQLACDVQPCGRLSKPYAKFVDDVMAYRKAVRVPLPKLAELPVDYTPCCEVGGKEPAADNPVGLDPHADFVTYLADRMLWYFEWSHVDGAFDHVIATFPGMSFHSDLDAP